MSCTRALVIIYIHFQKVGSHLWPTRFESHLHLNYGKYPKLGPISRFRDYIPESPEDGFNQIQIYLQVLPLSVTLNYSQDQLDPQGPQMLYYKPNTPYYLLRSNHFYFINLAQTIVRTWKPIKFNMAHQ